MFLLISVAGSSRPRAGLGPQLHCQALCGETVRHLTSPIKLELVIIPPPHIHSQFVKLSIEALIAPSAARKYILQLACAKPPNGTATLLPLYSYTCVCIYAQR